MMQDETVLRRRSLTLGLLTLTYFFSFMDRQILSILLESIKADLKLSDSQLGILSGLVFAIFYASLGLPIARFADRSNRRNIIAASLALWSFMTAVCGLATSFTHLLLARVGVGIGEAGSGPSSQSIIADLYPPERRAGAMAVYSLGVLLGGGFGMAIGGVVAHSFGWRAAMMVVGLPGIALALIIRLVVAEPRRGLSEPSSRPAIADVSDAPTIRQGMAALRRSGPALSLVAALTTTSLVGYAILGWGPSYMQRSLGLSLLDVSTYIALPGAVLGSVFAFAAGKLSDRAARLHGIHAQSWIVAAMKLAAFPFAILFYCVDDLGVALGSYFVAVAFIGVEIGPTYAMIQSLAPLRMRSTWAALMLMSASLIGLGLGPYLVGVASDLLRPTYGAQSLRWAMVLVVSLTPLAVFFYWRAGVLVSRNSTRSFETSADPRCA